MSSWTAEFFIERISDDCSWCKRRYDKITGQGHMTPFLMKKQLVYKRFLFIFQRFCYFCA